MGVNSNMVRKKIIATTDNSKWEAPKKRKPMTEEQKKAASERLAKARATKLAKKKILDKVYPQYDDLPLQQKVQIDQKIQQKYSGIIAKLSQKLMITVKKNEKENLYNKFKIL